MVKKFAKNATDSEKWQWVLENKDNGIIVALDNDETYVIDEDGDEVINFTYPIGQRVSILLEVLGIEAECV